MEKKINIAELLKDCPIGMELDCALFENLEFDHIDKNSGAYSIICRVKTEWGGYNVHTFTEYGCYSTEKYSKCVIFPKGKKTWKEFHRPFKDGDIIYVCDEYSDAKFTYVAILKQIEKGEKIQSHCFYNFEDDYFSTHDFLYDGYNTRFATEKEKETLFKTIKDNGYKWNEETKTLEKLFEPKFHKGDWVTDGINKCQIYFIDNTNYWYSDNCILGSIESVDKRYHLWTIDDAIDGNVLFHLDSASNGIFIFKEILQLGTIQKVICYCDYDSEDGFCLGENHTCCWTDSKIIHPATEKQRNLLFQKMKEAGYKWNPETRTLEKLVEPKFKVGDKVESIFNKNQYIITELTDAHYVLVEVNNKFRYVESIIEDKNWKLVIEPKFKVGDRIRWKEDHNYIYTITDIREEENKYECGVTFVLRFSEQDNWELVPNKFDITTLKPFDKVLVAHNKGEWHIQFFEKYSPTSKLPFICIGGSVYQKCVPYEENKHLMDTTNDCDEYYKIWKN